MLPREINVDELMEFCNEKDFNYNDFDIWLINDKGNIFLFKYDEYTEWGWEYIGGLICYDNFFLHSTYLTHFLSTKKTIKKLPVSAYKTRVYKLEVANCDIKGRKPWLLYSTLCC